MIFFLRKKSQKQKIFLRNNHYFSDFFPTNSDLFNIKTLNEKISKNAIFTKKKMLFLQVVNCDQMQKIKKIKK